MIIILTSLNIPQTYTYSESCQFFSIEMTFWNRPTRVINVSKVKRTWNKTYLILMFIFIWLPCLPVCHSISLFWYGIVSGCRYIYLFIFKPIASEYDVVICSWPKWIPWPQRQPVFSNSFVAFHQIPTSVILEVQVSVDGEHLCSFTRCSLKRTQIYWSVSETLASQRQWINRTLILWNEVKNVRAKSCVCIC